MLLEAKSVIISQLSNLYRCIKESVEIKGVSSETSVTIISLGMGVCSRISSVFGHFSFPRDHTLNLYVSFSVLYHKFLFQTEMQHLCLVIEMNTPSIA